MSDVQLEFGAMLAPPRDPARYRPYGNDRCDHCGVLLLNRQRTTDPGNADQWSHVCDDCASVERDDEGEVTG